MSLKQLVSKAKNIFGQISHTTVEKGELETQLSKLCIRTPKLQDKIHKLDQAFESKDLNLPNGARWVFPELWMFSKHGEWMGDVQSPEESEIVWGQVEKNITWKDADGMMCVGLGGQFVVAEEHFQPRELEILTKARKLSEGIGKKEALIDNFRSELDRIPGRALLKGVDLPSDLLESIEKETQLLQKDRRDSQQKDTEKMTPAKIAELHSYPGIRNNHSKFRSAFTLMAFLPSTNSRMSFSSTGSDCGL